MSSRGRVTVWALAVVAALGASGGCALGLRYVRPEAPAAPAFKEAPPPGFAVAAPRDEAARGPWWSVFDDPTLDTLERRVAISNQNVLAAEAQYRAARAAVRAARASLVPTLDLTPSATRAGAGSGAPTTRLAVPADVSYTADVWGGIRRSVAAGTATAQATAAQLEAARLSYQAELAADYFELQGIDAERRLLTATVASFDQSRQLTQNRFDGGVATMGDVALATAQLEGARAQLADLEIPRAQFEHAIAVLTGQLPEALSLPERPAQARPPAMAVGLPATLLERRPDIAAAERQVAAANAQVGVARAAYFPALTLSGSAASDAATMATLFTVPTRLWSLGAQLAGTVFDGGRRRAQVRLSEATYDATVAGYRQAVLTAFQQVDDALVAERVLADEGAILARAVAAAQQSLDISTSQYRGGITSYLQVITAQTSLLQNQRAEVDLLTRRLQTSVSLIQALGGGWEASQLPASADVRK